MNLPDKFTITLTDEHLRKAAACVNDNGRLIEGCLIAQAAKEVLGRAAWAGGNCVYTEAPSGKVYCYHSPEHAQWTAWFDRKAPHALPESLPSDMPHTLEYTREAR